MVGLSSIADSCWDIWAFGWIGEMSDGIVVTALNMGPIPSDVLQCMHL